MSKQEPVRIDLPDLRETFADSVRFIGFDGQTWRLEFDVTRIQPEQVKPGMTAMPMNQYPACRLVLPMATGIDLLNKLNQTADAMEKQGILKKNEVPKPYVMPEQKGTH